ncbi:protein EXPORTIN 1A-like [Trifolium pratense]|uniref:protein EXPORTIN 1A-like n=1 Tax=Trifolium pratense TaxID=57577 RepID=UPI001E6972C7|nr:protein EXPORTIN 1A-like [Trifolium pratense]
MSRFNSIEGLLLGVCSKENETIILKHEWPARWRSFIPDLVSAAKTSETICENCMAILKLLSEEVFDFSRGEMTQQKINELKHSLNRHKICKVLFCQRQVGMVIEQASRTPLAPFRKNP